MGRHAQDIEPGAWCLGLSAWALLEGLELSKLVSNGNCGGC